MLQALSELTAADVLGAEEEGDEREGEIAELTGKLVVLDHRIQDAEQKASDPEEETPEVYVGLLNTTAQASFAYSAVAAVRRVAACDG